MVCVEDIMVRNPLTAEPWHLVAHARKAMLANSFSCLPIFIKDNTDNGGSWKLLMDFDLVRFLQTPFNNESHKDRLSSTIENSFKGGRLKLRKATCIAQSTPKDEVFSKMKIRPILIVDANEPRAGLVGIVTPFDLL